MFLHNFRQFLENWIFEGISTGADLTKTVKICIILICAKKIFFGKIIYSTHQKKCFSTSLGNFWKIEFSKEISTGGDLTKMVKICIISICAKKIFFGKIIFSTHQRKSFSTILRDFWKIELLKEYRQARTLQKWWKFVLSQFVLWKYFLQNFLFHSSKEVFLHNFRQFLENWIFEGISTGAILTKTVKICIILICAKKIVFGKIIYSTHQKKCFSTSLGNFWKIEFSKEYRQARTLQKWWKFVLS